MPRVSQILRDAQTVADFSNLEPRQVEYFRNNYPEFAPKAWWEKKVPVLDRATERSLRKLIEQKREWSKEELREKLKWIDAEGKSNPPENQWQVTQAYLRDWWKSRFKDDVQFLVVLLNSVFDPSRTELTQMLRWMKRLYSSRSLSRFDLHLQEGYIPMQGAIVYLFGSPWRARFCEKCKKRFVAAEPRNKFCSDACYREHRLQQQLESWHKHKNEWRPPRPGTRQKLKKRKGR